MGYKVISSIHGIKCGCFKCASKHAEEDFKIKSQQLFKHVGFVPRDFDIPTIKSRKKQEISSQFLMSLNSKIEEVNRLNEDFKSTTKIPPAYCFDCGLLHTRSSKRVILFNGKKVYICSNCFKNKYYQCAHCKQVSDKQEGIKISSGVVVCQDCYKNKYKQCEFCHNNVLKEFLTETTYGPNLTKKNLCGACISKLAHCCECGVLEFKQNMVKIASATETQPIKFMCQSCKEENLLIKSYHHKPKPIWQLREKQTFHSDMLMFGVEWEVENSGMTPHEEVIKKLMEILGKKTFYCKSDSTIQNGFEIVTHPFSWENYQDSVEKWNEAIHALYTMGVRHEANDSSWGKTCGIHIHMSKDAFTTAHLYKFFNFIYTKPHRKFIIDVSQRGKESGFAKFYDSDLEGAKQCAKLKQNVSGEHHSAVELLHPTTVEIRIFNSTMDRIDFHKNIEFCHSLYQFTASSTIKGVTLPNYLEYIVKQKPKEYKNLYEFLRDKVNFSAYTDLKLSTAKF